MIISNNLLTSGKNFLAHYIIIIIIICNLIANLTFAEYLFGIREKKYSDFITNSQTN